MKTRHTLLAICAAIATASTAGLANARPDMAGPGMGQGMGMGMHGTQGPEAAAAVATRLTAAKAALKITAAQEAAWGKYASVMAQLAQASDAMRAQMQSQMQAQTQGKQPSAEERAKLRDTIITLRTEHQAQRAVAVKDLYAVLTPEQRVIAEEYLPGQHGHRMAGHGGRGMGSMGGMGAR